MIHEMIHATIFRYMLIAAETGTLEPENGMTQQQLINYINNLKSNFPGIHDYYYERELPNWQHEMMAQHYRGIIIQALIEFDNSHPSELYEALAWVGLKGTVAWNSLSPEQQAIYNQMAQDFANSD